MLVKLTSVTNLVVRQHAGLLRVLAGISRSLGRIAESVFRIRRQRVRLPVKRQTHYDLRRIRAQFPYQFHGRVLENTRFERDNNVYTCTVVCTSC